MTIFLTAIIASAQNVNHPILFYNLENMYDTINSPGVDDRDYTSNGSNKWNKERYTTKLLCIGQVVSDVALEAGGMPTIIGFCEVENRDVLEDIASLESLSTADYGVVHYDSPYYRGLDVALLYRKQMFNVRGSRAVAVHIDGVEASRSRDILTVWGELSGEDVFVVACHWASRYGGEEKSAPSRMALAQQTRAIVDSVVNMSPDTKIIVMGDFNDNPTNASLHDVLGAKGSVEGLKSGELFNPYYEMLIGGLGSTAYRGEWFFLDNIIVSENLLCGDGLRLQPSRSDDGYYGSLFRRDYMFQRDGYFIGYPCRTYAGGKYLGGYSDHLPIYINIGN